jgi:hypothetical protein
MASTSVDLTGRRRDPVGKALRDLRDSRDAEWVFPATIFVAIQYGLALPLSAALGFPHVPPLFGYFVISCVVTVAGSVVLLVRALWHLYRKGEEHPTRALLKMIAQYRIRLLVGAWGIQLVQFQVGSLTWLKTLMPMVVPFWADPYLADLDNFLFFGMDPWRLLRPALDPIGPTIASVYLLWFPIKAYVVWILLLSLPAHRKSRAMLAYFLTFGIFGVVGQYALSSAGPIFYELLGHGRRFAELNAQISPSVAAGRDYLWHTYLAGGDKIGGGISAMPSMHVAMALWAALAVQSLFRPFAWAGWLFFTMILIGSVYLGWHYAVDSFAGAGAALIAWGIAGRVTTLFTKGRVGEMEAGGAHDSVCDAVLIGSRG